MIKYQLLISVAEKMMSSQTVKAEDLFDFSNIPFFAFNSNDEFVEVSKEEFAACEELNEEGWFAIFKRKGEKRNRTFTEFDTVISFLTQICIYDKIPRYYVLKERNGIRSHLVKTFATIAEAFANEKEE